MRTGSLSYSLIFLAACLCACRKEGMDGGGASILFSASLPEISAVSKASFTDTPPTSQEYLNADGNVIGVFATWTPPASGAEEVDVFNKLPVSCTDNGEGASPRYVWDYDNHKYWRQGGQYHFCAVFPYSVNTEYGSYGARIVTSYFMKSDNYDLLVASSYRDLRSSDDTSPVHFAFSHACAAVRVLFSKGSEDNLRHYYLRSCEFQYLKTVGTLIYEGDIIDINSWQTAEFRSASAIGWSAATEEERIDVPDNWDDFKSLDHPGWKNWYFVVPQELDVDDGFTPAIRFSVDVEQYVDDGEGNLSLAYSSSSPVFTSLALPLRDSEDNKIVWEPGKVYTYYIMIQPGEEYVTVSVTDWDKYYVYVDDIVF